VGRNGVVVVTFDEDHSADGAGIVSPLFTAIVPGTNAAGTPARSPLPAATRCRRRAAPTRRRSTTTSSTARSLIEAAGGTCAVFDNTSLYQGQTTTARQNCHGRNAAPAQRHRRNAVARGSPLGTERSDRHRMVVWP
jgi:hypothetical protein